MSDHQSDEPPVPQAASAPRLRFLDLAPPARARWLDPAEAEFCAHGFEGASLNRIVAAAQESKGRTYHYFANKGELFRATLERRLEPLGDLLPAPEALAAPGRAAFWETLSLLGLRLTEVLQRDRGLAALLRCVHREAAAREALAAPLAALHRRIAALLAAGQSVQAVRDDLPLSLLADVALDLLTTVDRWFAQHGAGLAPAEETELSQRAFGLLMAPLMPPLPSHRPDERTFP